MLRKLLAVDHQYARRVATECGHRHFPAEFRDVVIGEEGVDLLESLITLVKQVPESDSPEDVATVTEQVERTAFSFEATGWRTIVCPSKRSGDGYKHSDDQRLIIETLVLAMRLRPDFVVLFAGDGDFAPMVWSLRAEGIRTEVVASEANLASDLKRAAFNVVEAEPLLGSIDHNHD